ncbi:MAG: hypothetical protein I8H77_14130 [Comamonadaceae bacterium]|nr:hypothetical protein [Comamonadaceae bacterium]
MQESTSDTGGAEGLTRAHIELMDLLSYIYLRHGLPDKAAALLIARDLLVPDNRVTLLTLAIAQVRAVKYERALETLERLAMLGAVDASFHLVRAQAFQALGRTGEAASAMRAHVSLRASL